MKAIMVIDMPENCNKCVFRVTDNDSHRCCATLPRIKLGEIRGYIPRHVYCPLKPLPQYQCEDRVYGYGAEYEDGFDSCLDEILGETE